MQAFKENWRVIFRMRNLDKIATAKLKEQIDTFIERNADRPFTMHNIYRMLETVFDILSPLKEVRFLDTNVAATPS